MKNVQEIRGSDPAEEAVSGYLTYLKDPSSLIDKTKIRELTARLESSVSTLEQLQIATELHRVESVDEGSITGAFIRHAAAYSKREGLAPEAFLRLGVPREVAQEAGLLETTGKQSTRSKVAAKSKTAAKTCSPRTGREDVVAAVPASSFTYRDLEELSGASVVTVRRVVDDLLSSGVIVDIGVDPDYAGRGRAPRRFEPATTRTPSVKTSTGRTAAAKITTAKAPRKPSAKKPSKKR